MYSAYLVQYVKKLFGEKVEESGEEHGLDVGNELGLSDQPVKSGTLL